MFSNLPCGENLNRYILILKGKMRQILGTQQRKIVEVISQSPQTELDSKSKILWITKIALFLTPKYKFVTKNLPTSRTSCVIISEGGSINGVNKKWSDLKNIGGFNGGSVVKNIPAMQEIQVRSLEKEMATCSSILAQEVLWAEEPGGIQSMGPQKSQTQLSD